MDNILRNAVEQRRKNIMNILLALNIYRSEEELVNLSLTELEEEFKRVTNDSHPHCETSSLQWKKK